MSTCDVLLAAYNGSRFGPALLDSLLSQSNQDFRLLVRDDGSTDDTLAILEQYQPRFGGRMQILESGTPTGSALGNFSILMEASDADYILFADIDDVWLTDKIECTLRLLAETEKRSSPSTPIYAFTDVTPVAADLRPIAASYWRFKRINPKLSPILSRSLVCAPMLGCASGINRALAKIATPVPAAATGHDWWALLIACALGQVVYSPENTLLYRLHGNNSSAQKEVSLSSYLQTGNRKQKVRRGMMRRFEQAQALLDLFGDQMTDSRRDLLRTFIIMERKGFLSKRLDAIRHAFLYPDLPRNIAMLSLM